jgi:plasmid replication initiation protein
MGDNEKKKLSLDNMVVKSNKLVNGKYNLKTIDHKMMLTLCSLISSKDDDFIEVTLTVDEMADLFNIKRNDKYELYRILSKECKKLLGATIEYDESTEKGKRKWKGMTIFSTMQYDEGKGQVKMKFNEDMKEFLLDIKETYTKFKLRLCCQF